MGLEPEYSCLNVEAVCGVIGVVVLEFAVVLVEDGVDFCGGLAFCILTAAGFVLTVMFCPDELIAGILGRESL